MCINILICYKPNNLYYYYCNNSDLPIVKMDVLLQLQVHSDVLQQVLQVNDIEALDKKEEEEEMAEEEEVKEANKWRSGDDWFL